MQPVELFEVQSDSMAPLLVTGDVVAVERVPWQALRRLDVVVVSRRSRTGDAKIVHRLLGVRRRAGRVFLVTRGDSHWGCDPPSRGERLSGRVVQRLSADGAWLDFRSGPGRLLSLWCLLRATASAPLKLLLAVLRKAAIRLVLSRCSAGWDWPRPLAALDSAGLAGPRPVRRRRKTLHGEIDGEVVVDGEVEVSGHLLLRPGARLILREGSAVIGRRGAGSAGALWRPDQRHASLVDPGAPVIAAFGDIEARGTAAAPVRFLGPHPPALVFLGRARGTLEGCVWEGGSECLACWDEARVRARALRITRCASPIQVGGRGRLRLDDSSVSAVLGVATLTSRGRLEAAACRFSGLHGPSLWDRASARLSDCAVDCPGAGVLRASGSMTLIRTAVSARRSTALEVRDGARLRSRGSRFAGSLCGVLLRGEAVWTSRDDACEAGARHAARLLDGARLTARGLRLEGGQALAVESSATVTTRLL